MALLAQKKFGEAEDCFRSALTFKPEDYSFNFNWGVAAASAGKIGEAEKHLREARRLAPDNAVVKQTLQLVLQREQRAGMTVKSAAGEK